MVVAYKSINGSQGGSGSISITPPLNAVGDLLLCFIATANEAAAAPTGFTLFETTAGQGTPGAIGAILLQAFWRWADGTNTAFTAADPGDHWAARIISLTGVKLFGNPIDATSKSSKSSASTSSAIPGVTARQPGDIIYVSARDFDSAAAQASGEANASLTGLVERGDAGTGLGTGSGLAIYTGTLAAPGASGTVTATLANSSTEEYMAISLLAEYATKGRKTLSSLGTRFGSRQLQGA